MYFMRENGMIPSIGQPWMGKHILLLHCSEDNKFLAYYKSNHAPIELPSSSCAESLSRLISIGYVVNKVTPLPGNRLQYLLVL